MSAYERAEEIVAAGTVRDAAAEVGQSEEDAALEVALAEGRGRGLRKYLEECKAEQDRREEKERQAREIARQRVMRYGS